MNNNGNRTAEEEAFSKIKDAIRNKQILPGRKLSETTLGEILGMSRTPVRAALKQLEYQGFVKIIPNKGAYVIEPSIEEIQSTYVVRIAMEQLAVSLLIDCLTDEKVSILETIIEDEKLLYEELKYDDYDLINTRFHITIAQLTGNQVLTQYITDMLNKVDGFILVYDENDPKSLPASIGDHRKLLDLIKDKNKSGARKFVAEHIRHAQKRLMLEYKDQSPQRDFLSI